MQILIASFKLSGIGHDEMAQVAEQFAPVFKDQIPGLYEKVFLSDPESGTYGGVYKFQDQASLDAYMASDVWQGLGADGRFVDFTVNTFGVFEGATRTAHGFPETAMV